jgi:hypothetical protein
MDKANPNNKNKKKTRSWYIAAAVSINVRLLFTGK